MLCAHYPTFHPWEYQDLTCENLEECRDAPRVIPGGHSTAFVNTEVYHQAQYEDAPLDYTPEGSVVAVDDDAVAVPPVGNAVVQKPEKGRHPRCWRLAPNVGNAATEPTFSWIIRVQDGVLFGINSEVSMPTVLERDEGREHGDLCVDDAQREQDTEHTQQCNALMWGVRRGQEQCRQNKKYLYTGAVYCTICEAGPENYSVRLVTRNNTAFVYSFVVDTEIIYYQNFLL